MSVNPYIFVLGKNIQCWKSNDMRNLILFESYYNFWNWYSYKILDSYVKYKKYLPLWVDL